MDQLQLNDFLTYRYLSNLQYAPDGQRAAFVAANANLDENNYESRLFLLENGSVRQLTDLGKERSYIWLDATHLLFPAVRSAKEKKRSESKEQFTSYYSLDIRGGEALPAFTLPFAASQMKVLDPTHFAVTGTIDASIPDYYCMTDDQRADVARQYADEKDYEVFDETPFWGNGQGVTNKQRTALFLVCTDPMTVSRVTDAYDDVGSMTVLGDEVFFAKTTFTARMPWRGCTVRAVNWHTGVVRTVWADDVLSVSRLLTAGDHLLMLGTRGERYGLNENDWVYTLTPDSGDLRLLNAAEYSMYSSVGSDCRYGSGSACVTVADKLYHLTTREGSSHLYCLTPDGQDLPVLTRDGSIDCIAASAHSSQLLMVAMFDMQLQELYSYDLSTAALTQLTHFNQAALAGKYVAQPIPMQVQSEGHTIDGWVLLPKDYDPARTYPAVLDIHGGPKTVYGPVFYHEMQLWASMGYFVFFCNPKGSDGRDNAFADIRGHYGETDYRNLMDFTDAVLSAYPQIDRTRVCETGGSYGGFMTNWIIGHTDRFCCTASQRSISNWLSFYGVSDIGTVFGTDQNAADPFTSPERMWKHSPLRYAANAVTPTLFIHSDEDYRCPLAEGLQMFTALADRGVPTRLCLFHGENHELSRSGKPTHRIRRLTEITNWFEKYAK